MFWTACSGFFKKMPHYHFWGKPLFDSIARQDRKLFWWAASLGLASLYPYDSTLSSSKHRYAYNTPLFLAVTRYKPNDQGTKITFF